MSVVESVKGVTDAVGSWFGYNRSNFQSDRKQRQRLEYKVLDQRIAQTTLWRDDVRRALSLPTKKMESYLLVIALELGFCILALCKGRVAPGAPAWLAACHTIAGCGAVMYFFLGLWFGMHAFVSSVAYMVRILTQLVRLPVPSWHNMETGRTYGSSFEKLSVGRMLRLPFTKRDGSAAQTQGADGSPGAADPSADPWGLEQLLGNIPELAPDVNVNTERQRHIWLVREASKFFQTYDAFCRICMSAGTTCLAQLFCYFCLSYAINEMGAPAAGWSGMVVFTICALVLLRNDVIMTFRQYMVAVSLELLSPTLCAIVSYKAVQNDGHPGKWERLAPLALFLHGVTQLYYIYLFRVEELHTGAVQASAFKAVLFTDTFGWAKHSSTPPAASRGGGGGGGRSGLRPGESTRGSGADGSASTETLPAMQSFAPNATGADAVPQRSPSPQRARSSSPSSRGRQALLTDVDNPSERAANFRSSTFVGKDDDLERENDLHGEKPGVMPWKHFQYITFVQAFLWFVASVTWEISFVEGSKVGVVYRDLDEGINGPVSLLVGQELQTQWHEAMLQPRGLACSPDGTVFVTSGVSADGNNFLLRGSAASSSVSFQPTPLCAESSDVIQDLDLHSCNGKTSTGCQVLVQPRESHHLVSCPLDNSNTSSGKISLHRSWLDDRGGVPFEDALEADDVGPDLLYPEDISSVVVVPCSADETLKAGKGAASCVVVGTTAGRVVQLAGDGDKSILSDAGGLASSGWAPQRMFSEDHGEPLASGALANIEGRYLLALKRTGGLLQAFDLLQGGTVAGVWGLPDTVKPNADDQGRRLKWASICAGGGALYALELRRSANPSLWRFDLPEELQAWS